VVLRFYRSGVAGRTRLTDLVRSEQSSFEELNPGLGGATFWLLRRSSDAGSTSYLVEAVFPPRDAVPETLGAGPIDVVPSDVEQ